MINIGFIGAGSIAEKMADTINHLDDFNNYAISSRSLSKSLQYKEKYGFEKAYGSYEEMLQDENIDLVYIATIHSAHYENLLLCLKYKKNVICEKIFTTDYQKTKEIYEEFKKANLFIVEALWTSFLPSRKIINDLIFDQKVIGDLKTIHAQFRLPIKNIERIAKKDLGGGTLMDLGVYPLSFVFRTIGFNYKKIEVNDILINKYGADIRENIILSYEGVTAYCNIDAVSYRKPTIKFVGDNGKIVVDSVCCPNIIKVYNSKNRLTKKILCAPSLGGFEYELKETKEALSKKKLETESWTHKNSLYLSKTIDKIFKEFIYKDK